MVVVVITSFLAILLAYLSKYKNWKNGLEWGGILVTFIACIHYDYGNDYMAYFLRWNDVRQMSLFRILAGDYRSGQEVGWYALNKLFGFNNGFYLLVALLNIFQNYVYYKLIKKYVPTDWTWLAVAIYLCSSSYYLLNFSVMRQGLSLTLFVLAIMLANDKNYLWAVVVVLAAPSFHKSAYFVIPFFLVYLLPLRNTKPIAAFILILTIIIFESKGFVSNLYDTAMMFDEIESYGHYVQNDTSIAGIGFILNSIPYAVMLLSLWNQSGSLNIQLKILIILTFVGLVFYPISIAIEAQAIGRLGNYFSVFSIVVIPYLYKQIKKRDIRYGLTFIFVFMLIIRFFGFFNDPSYKEPYSTFHTIFSVL